MTSMLNNGATYLPSAGEGPVPQWTGTYAAIVVNNHDPLGVGRLQLNVPQVLGNAVSTWAVPAGSYYSIPANGTALSCVFIGGDPAKPAWNGPLDLSPLVESAAPPTVSYGPTAPVSPRVGDIWYQTVGGIQEAPAVWTFNSGTSTYSWVTQAKLGGVAIAAATISGLNTGAAFHGLNMIPDPQFSSTDLNTVRSSDPATNATWTFSAGTAAVTAGTPAMRLALMPSGSQSMWVNPGEQYYLSITGVTTASCQVGIEIETDSGATLSVNATFSGTQTVSGVVTIPSGAHWAYVRIFAYAGTGSPTATLSNPICQPSTLNSPNISGGTITGSQVVADGASGEILVYSGVPATGNLIASLSGASGTDGQGNAYPTGLKINGTSGGSITMDPSANAGVPYIVLAPAGATKITTEPQIYVAPTNAGLANEIEIMYLYSGDNRTGNSNSSLQLWSQAADGTVMGSATFVMNGQLVKLGTTGPGYLPVTQVDNLFTTQTGTSPSRLFKTWSIPANDYQNGTTYRLSSFGNGNWGGVPVTFQIASPWGTLAALPIGGTQLATSTAFSWDLVATVIINQTGSSGIVAGSISLNLSQSANNELTNAGTSNSAGGFVRTSLLDPVNVPLTGGNLTVQVAFGTGGTSPSITSWGSVFERIGANP